MVTEYSFKKVNDSYRKLKELVLVLLNEDNSVTLILYLKKMSFMLNLTNKNCLVFTLIVFIENTANNVLYTK